jgi:hypothetical protein
MVSESCDGGRKHLKGTKNNALLSSSLHCTALHGMVPVHHPTALHNALTADDKQLRTDSRHFVSSAAPGDQQEPCTAASEILLLTCKS